MSGVLKWPGDSRRYADLQQTQVEREFEKGEDIKFALRLLPIDLDVPVDVMDIGGGIGRAVYHMHKYWLGWSADNPTRFWLYDDGGEEQHAGINTELTDDTYYSNHDVAFEWLCANGVDNGDEHGVVEYLDACDRDQCLRRIVDTNVRMDLVTSFRAVGFHWPMHPLLGFLADVTRPGSLLLFESRPLHCDAYPEHARFKQACKLVSDDLGHIAESKSWRLAKYQHVQVGPHLRAYVLAERV